MTRENLHRVWCGLCLAIIAVSLLYAIITKPGLGGYVGMALEMIP